MKTALSLYFKIIRILFDCISIPITIIIAYSLKFKIGWVFQNVFMIGKGTIYPHAQVEPYLNGSITIGITWILAFYITGVYKNYRGIMPEVDEIVKVIKGSTLATLFIIAEMFIFQVIPESRFVIFYMWLIGIILLSVHRVILTNIEISCLKKGINTQKALVIGTNDIGQDVIERMIINPSLRYTYVGSLGKKRPPKVLHYHLKKKFNYLGRFENYKKVLEKNIFHAIFVTEPLQNHTEFNNLVHYCEKNDIELNLLSDLSSFMSGMLQVINFEGLPFISHHNSYAYEKGFIYKRLFDLSASLLALTVLSPLFLVIGLTIKIASPTGPIIYKQTRIGRNGKLFEMFKFRTMVPDAEKHGPRLVKKGGKDERYIPSGKLLRKYSLDELPQLLNIVRGEMSVVGPRPERQHFIKKFKQKIPHFDLRHRVLGGLTGWAQINGRSVLTRRPDHKIKYDLYYIKNWSFVLDIKIILKTILMVLKGEEAY